MLDASPSPEERVPEVPPHERITDQEFESLLMEMLEPAYRLALRLTGDSEDAQEDVMTADDIEQAAHYYLTKSRVIGSGHNTPIDASPVESYIVPQDFQIGGQYGDQLVKKGSWVLGIKIKDPNEWDKVLKGEYQSVSVGGFGLRRQA